MKKVIQNKYLSYIIMFLLTLTICVPIFSMNLHLNNEAILHMTRIFSVNEIMKDGIFPPIIDYKFMNGFGYALNLFYGPLTTYIPVVLLNMFGTAGLALKIFTILTVIFSAITMYHFTYTVFKRKSIALIATLIYISVPYKLSDIYSRNAVGEYTAFIFIPIVFESLYNLLNTDKKKNLMLSVGIIGLVLSHTITTIYIALFSLIYLILNIEKLKNIEIWKTIGINILISFLICGFYVIPLLEHSIAGNYALYDKELMGTEPWQVYNTALGLKDLFTSEFGTQNIRFSIGIVVIILTLLIIVCIKKIKSTYKKVYTDFLILSVITLFMSTKLFPWMIMPNVLTVIQFAWRNIGFFAFFISIICGVNAVIFAENIIRNDIWKDTFLFGTICSIFVFAFLGVFRNFRFDDISLEKNLDNDLANSERIYIYKVNREYLPLNAFKNLEYINKRENRTYVLKGNFDIISENKNKLEDTIITGYIQENTEIELPYIYYLGYDVTITSNGKVEKLKTSESQNGFLKVTLPKVENATINVKYKGTTLEKISYIISLVGIVICIIYKYIEKRSNNEAR